MKKQILSEEFRRMQKLAGLITESEYKENINEDEEAKSAADKAIKVSSPLEKSPEMDELAAKVAKNPTLMAQLEKAVKAAGVNVELTEGESGLDMGDLKTMALNLAKKGENLKEEISSDPDKDTSSFPLGMTAFIGGSGLGQALSSTIISIIPSAASVFAGPALLGALAGVALFVLARKVYLKSTGK